MVPDETPREASELTADETSATGPSGAAFIDSDAPVPDHYEHDRLLDKRLTSIGLIVVAALILLGAAAVLTRFVGEHSVVLLTSWG